MSAVHVRRVLLTYSHHDRIMTKASTFEFCTIRPIALLLGYLSLQVIAGWDNITFLQLTF